MGLTSNSLSGPLFCFLVRQVKNRRRERSKERKKRERRERERKEPEKINLFPLEEEGARKGIGGGNR